VIKINDEKEKKMKSVKMLAVAAAIVVLANSSAMATFSGQIWIPSTDVKGFKEVNISVDNYIRFSNSSDAGVNTYDIGVTAGVLPLEKFKLEVGVDYITDNVAGSNAANHPAYFNFKGGIPEDAFFAGMPAIAAGMYGMNSASSTLSTNVAYALVAKTFPVVGRISVGGYNGAEQALGPQATGLLASWDRSMTEISDKLWLAVDYQGGNNFLGALSVGGSWAFTKNVSLLIGADFYNKIALGGKPTLTTQLDINF
jgi:hypothetical protein